MEHIQTVVVQVAADKLDEASRPEGLLAQLDQHKAFLQQQPGFQGVQVARSADATGNAVLEVETRWRDPDSLAQYEGREPNVAAIISRHSDLIVPESLRISSEEVTEARSAPTPAETHERLLLPLLVPLGVFLFGVLVVYGLSRIYLEVPAHVATPMALGIALGILFLSWYLASNPGIPRWQIGGIALMAAALLTGGAIYAAVHEDKAETAATPEPGAAAAAASPEAPTAAAAGPADATIAMVPSLKFEQTELAVAAGTQLTLAFDNRDTGIPHNWALYRDEGHSDPLAGANDNICTGPCSGQVTFGPLDPGTYFFRCDVHPQQMMGTLIAQ